MKLDWFGLATLSEPEENGTLYHFTVSPTGAPFQVTVELAPNKAVRGVSFRLPRSAAAEEGVSLRELRRLPLDRIVKAAQVAADAPTDGGPSGTYPMSATGRAARDILVPRGRPARGDDFYKAIATAYREFTRLGLSPAKEIAHRKHVSRNLVDQWISRARKLGFLEPPPPRRKARNRR